MPLSFSSHKSRPEIDLTLRREHAMSSVSRAIDEQMSSRAALNRPRPNTPIPCETQLNCTRKGDDPETVRGSVTQPKQKIKS